MRGLFSFCLLFLIGPHSLSGQPAFKEEDVSFRNQQIQLAGVVLKPQKPVNPATAVVIIQGSGNSDRTNSWAYSFAKDLAEKGIYVLLPDKRGCGKSGGDWKKAGMKELATDAIAGLDFLLKRKEFLIKRIGLAGLSQGGMIAPLAASLSSKIDFIVDIVGSAATLEETSIHEMVNTCRQNGLAGPQLQQVLALHAAMKNFVIQNDWNTYQRILDSLRESPLAEFAKGFPATKDAWLWQWIRLNFNYDPAFYWKQVKKPVLVIYGEKDEQDNTPVWRSCYILESVFQSQNHKDYIIKVFENTGHALYETDKTVVRKDILDFFSGWILKTVTNTD